MMAARDLFDFDRIDLWGLSLRAHLSEIVPPDLETILRARQPQYIEDAVELFFSMKLLERSHLIALVSQWLTNQTIAGFHGSRLTDDDLANIRDRGIVPLAAEDRKSHLRAKLSRHPRWQQVEATLDGVIDRLGRGQAAGNREGQVHATLSRGGLLRGFNHYLTHGSEFDQHAATELLGNEGKAMLAAYGTPTLITIAVPGDEAIKAANPYWPLQRDNPNFIREVIDYWIYWLSAPQFSVAAQETDCGLIFNSRIPAEQIHNIETIAL